MHYGVLVMETRLVKLSNVAVINPRLRLAKNEVARKISMEALTPFQKNIDSYSFEKYSGGVKFQNGDTLVARITPSLENGKTSYVDILDADEIAFGSTEFIVLRADKHVLDKEYLYYIATSDDFRQVAIQSMTGTSGRQRVQNEAVSNYELKLPPLDVQKQVVFFLDSIDAKIELNQQINKNLLRLMNVQWTKMFGSLDAEKGHFTDLADVTAGGTPSKKNDDYFGGNIPWVTPKDMSLTNDVFIERGSLNITDAGLKGSSAKLLPKGTLLFSSRAPIGYLGIAANPVTTNQGFKSLVPKRDENTEYLYFLLKSLTPYIEEISGGSTFKEISGAGMKSVEFPLPTDDQIDAFHNKVKRMFDMVRNNEQQNKNLTKLRDLLLPRLLAGGIDLSNIETVMNND